MSRTCRFLPFGAADAGWQLACSEAVLQLATELGGPTLRWYTVTPAALYLGAGQRTDVVDIAACRAATIAVYRRSAGGTVVLADDGILCCDLVLPAGDPLLERDLTQSYRWLGQVWSAALRRLGLSVAVVSVEEARRATRRHEDAAAERIATVARPACFGGLSPFEVTLAGRKLVGLAQVRRRQGALFQMAVLLSWDPQRLSRYLAAADEHERAERAAALRERAVGLNDGRSEPLAAAAIMSAVEGCLAEHGLRCVDGALSLAERSLAARLASERYAPLDL